jgi:hypothetical protein
MGDGGREMGSGLNASAKGNEEYEVDTLCV